MQPYVFPRVYAEQGRDVDTAQGLLGLLGFDVLPRRIAESAGLHGVYVLGVQVDGLAAVVGATQRAAGEVGGHNLQRVVRGDAVGLDEPDEARAEHCLCCEDHGIAERVERGEVSVYERLDVFRGRRPDVWVGVDAAEEEVVVVGHRGEVEHVGLVGIAGKLDDEGLGVHVLLGES